MKEASAILNDEEPQNEQGLVSIAAAEKQSGTGKDKQCKKMNNGYYEMVYYVTHK